MLRQLQFGLIYVSFYSFKRRGKTFRMGVGKAEWVHLFPLHITKDCVADKNVFHATKYSSQNPLRARENAKSSTVHESVQVLHLLPFISLWTSPAGVCRSNISVGSSAFLSHLLLLLLVPTLSSLSFSHWGISTPLREPLMNTGAHLELRDLPEAFQSLTLHFNVDF